MPWDKWHNCDCTLYKAFSVWAVNEYKYILENSYNYGAETTFIGLTYCPYLKLLGIESLGMDPKHLYLKKAADINCIHPKCEMPFYSKKDNRHN